MKRFLAGFVALGCLLVAQPVFAADTVDDTLPPEAVEATSAGFVLVSDADAWTPEQGDWFEVNVETNVGRLHHTNGAVLEFEVVTGQQRVVYYAGSRYFAATPAADWVVKQVAVKRDRVTFGKTGRFLRLFVNDGVKATPYGIHGFGYEDRMFKVAGRYGSMGCIIVREKILNIIEQTYRVNGEQLVVKTYPDMMPRNSRAAVRF